MSVVEPLDIKELLEPDDGPITLGKNGKKKKEKKNIYNWGFAGHLTKEEGDVYLKFRAEVTKRGGEFKKTVYSFSEEEGEAYCLTRWLRARKYVYSDVIKMVEEATECRSEPLASDYYPDPKAALGIDPAVFISQYPQLYSGFSKIGCPVFYSKPGLLRIAAVECTTTMSGILNYHWHVMQHDYRKRLLGFKEENPEFKRFECVSILDLANLTVGQLGNRTLEIIKKQAFIDSLCFPETMNKTIIVNAPRFFSVTWGLIKGWLDARTVSKIEMFTSIKSAQPCLRELIDVDQIPSDYGGTGESTLVTMEKNGMKSGGMSRLVAELLHIRTYQNITITLEEGEEIDVHIHTRAVTGAVFNITESSSKKVIVEDTTVQHTVPHDVELNSESPCDVHLTAETGRIKGPMTIKVKGTSLGGMLGTENFMVVGYVFGG